MKTNLKRLEVKYVRDGIKSHYPIKSECYISGSTEDLQLHHYQTVTFLWKRWKTENGVQIYNVDDIKEFRKMFYMEEQEALLEDVVTLTSYWHNERLHKVYGIAPPLHTAGKQRRWVERMREKHYGAISTV